MADTQPLAPTDAELDELRQANSGRLNFVTFSEFRTIARAVLARWGQPAHSGEPVAWKHDCAALLTNDVELWIDACPHCSKPRNAPQPVERDPLTADEQDGLYWRMHSLSKSLEGRGRIDEYDTPDAYRTILDAMNALRDKKGGQHGTE